MSRHQGGVRCKSVSIGFTAQGNKEVLDLWMEPTEGAKFWLEVVSEFKMRGAPPEEQKRARPRKASSPEAGSLVVHHI